jgi:hypothetical protein
MKLPLIVAAAACLTPAIAEAQRWVALGRAVEGGFEAFYDAARVRHEGRSVYVWTRSNGMISTPGMSYGVAQVRIDCVAETAELIITMAHRADGRIIDVDRRRRGADPIPPGSVFEALMRRVCGRTHGSGR